MEPFEIMTSESQERMLAIVNPENLEKVLLISEKWEIRSSVVGKVTEGGQLRILTASTDLFLVKYLQFLSMKTHLFMSDLWHLL